MTPIMLDSVVAILILLSMIFAFFRGFVREMLTIVNIVGSSAAAYYLSPLTATWFEGLFMGDAKDIEHAPRVFGIFPADIMAVFASYTAVFFAVFLILTLAGLYISSTVKALGLGPADKTLGVLFGAVRGFLIVFIFYLPFAYIAKEKDYPDWAKDSISVHYLKKTYEAGEKYMNPKNEDGTPAEQGAIDPDSLAGKLKKMADDAKNKARDRVSEAADQAAQEEEAAPELSPDEQAEQLP